MLNDGDSVPLGKITKTEWQRSEDGGEWRIVFEFELLDHPSEQA